MGLKVNVRLLYTFTLRIRCYKPQRRKESTASECLFIRSRLCTHGLQTRSNIVNQSHTLALVPGGRPVAPVASRVVKLIFTTKRLPLPAAAAPALALLHDPLLNNCDSVGGDCVTLRSSWSVYCNPRTRLRNRVRAARPQNPRLKKHIS